MNWLPLLSVGVFVAVAGYVVGCAWIIDKVARHGRR